MIIKNKLLNACINGNGNIFDEIKKLRKAKPVLATRMESTTWYDIPGHFRGIFKDLYNSTNDKEELLQVLDDVERKISHSSMGLLTFLKNFPQLSNAF